MSYVTLPQAKAQLNIEADYTDEDAYIEGLIETAEDVVESQGRIDLTAAAEEHGGTLPPKIRHAVLLLVGEFYLHREATTDKKVYFDAVDRLVHLFTDYQK